VTSSDCSTILLRLEHLDAMLSSIYEEVRRTNGRVTELELVNAQEIGRAESRKVLTMVLGTALSGSLLAGIVWFVSNSIN